MILSEYSRRAFSKTKEIVGAFGELNKLIKFEAVAATGTSGLAISPILSHVFDKKLTIIQKKSTRRHSNQLVDGWVDLDYVIVDDFIGTGKTIKRIQDGLAIYNGKLNGIFLYNSNRFTPPKYIAKLGVPIYIMGENGELSINIHIKV